MSAPPCPHCGTKLFPHEVANGECSTCRRRLPAGFTAEAAPPPRDGPRRPTYDDEPPPPPDWSREPNPFLVRRPDASYGAVRAGVNLVRWVVGLNLVLAAVSAAAQVGAFASEEYEFRQLFLFGVGGVALLQGLLALLGLVGVFCCSAVPRESQAYGWSRVLIVSLAVALLLGVAAFVFFLEGLDRPMRRIEALELAMVGDLILLVLTVFVATLSFFLVLRFVARDFDAPGLGGGFLAFGVTWLAVPVMVLPAWFVLGVALGSGRLLRGHDLEALMFGLLGCFGVVYGFVMGVWLLTLLTRLYHRLSGAPVPRRWG
jgi:hypothetical protein